ncbi:MAG: HIT domain-containing protein [Patescibacteria group bacterium]|nr:HIT domain-containing protein [Patescibacteria group bacterium]
MDCLFCKIVAGEIPASKVYEDEKVLAFLDINPVSRGHVLIIPKEHYENMLAMPDELLQYIFLQAKNIMLVIKRATGADYVALSVVGIDVLHFHVHLIPRYYDDGLSSFWPTLKYQNNEMEEYQQKIIAEIK